MENRILFQTDKNWDRESGCERQKDVEKKENFISGEGLWFYEMNFFLKENSSSKWKKRRGRCRIELSLKLSQIHIENLRLNGRRNWKRRKISLVGRISVFTKWKFFLWKIRAQSARRKGGDAELNSLSNCHKLRSRIWVWTVEEMEKKGDFIGGEDFSF